MLHLLSHALRQHAAAAAAPGPAALGAVALQRTLAGCCGPIDVQQPQQHPHQQHHPKQQQQRLRALHTPHHHRGIHTSSVTCSEKRLSDLVKLERLQGETADAVEHIWLAQHASSTSHIATVLSRDEHAIVAARAAASPLFVLPLSKPQPGGFLTLLLQCQPPHRLLFTTLDEYKQWGMQAAPHLTVQFYSELADSHSLVLARGDLLNPPLINAAEGRTLLELALAFYRDPGAYKMVYAFNHSPAQFSFEELCSELGVGRSRAAGGAAGGVARPAEPGAPQQPQEKS